MTIITQASDIYFKNLEDEIKNEINSRLHSLLGRTAEENKNRIIAAVMDEYRVEAKVEMVQALEHMGFETRISVKHKMESK